MDAGEAHTPASYVAEVWSPVPVGTYSEEFYEILKL